MADQISFQPIIRQNLSSLSTVSQAAKPSQTSGQEHAGASFNTLMQKELQKAESSVTFSKHAMKRAGERGIEVTPQLMDRVSAAADRAEEKGVKDLLILGGQTAFIVNVPNRVVVTTMNGEDMEDNIFTNIDGTAFF